MSCFQVSHEYSSEVSTARQQAMQQLRQAEEMKTEFLKKLHKVYATHSFPIPIHPRLFHLLAV